MAGFSEEIYQDAKAVIMPAAKTEEDDSDDEDENGRKYKPREETIGVFGKKKIHKQHKKKFHSEFGQKKSKSWIMAKKERARKQGKNVTHDSKYSGRKRQDKF